MIYPKLALNSLVTFPASTPKHWDPRHVPPHPVLRRAGAPCTPDKRALSINCVTPLAPAPFPVSKMPVKLPYHWWAGDTPSFLGLPAPAHWVCFQTHTHNNLSICSQVSLLRREAQLSTGCPQPWGPCVLKTIFLLFWPSKHTASGLTQGHWSLSLGAPSL